MKVVPLTKYLCKSDSSYQNILQHLQYNFVIFCYSRYSSYLCSLTALSPRYMYDYDGNGVLDVNDFEVSQ